MCLRSYALGCSTRLLSRLNTTGGVRCWWLFLLFGLGCIVASLLAKGVVLAALLGVAGFSSLWSIIELFKQRERVRKGWFPRNPKRDNRYKE